jgi:uncharacterized protein YkwD
MDAKGRRLHAHKMRSRLLLIATVSAALLAPAAAQAADCPGADLIPDATNAAQVADATLCLINAERAAGGLAPLAADSTLTSASAAYAGDMIARSFFAHETPDGVTLDQRLAGVGYGYELAGENIAWGEGPLSTPASIVNAWMHSEGHRLNIMERDYRQIGLGILPGTPKAAPSSFAGATYVTDFGTPEAGATRSAARSGTLDASATSDPVAHYSVKHRAAKRKKAARRAHRRRAAKHARRHVRRHVRRHPARRQTWQTVS